MTMPEEVNRIVTDRLSTLRLTPSADANDNLRNEGCPAESIHFVGNVMIDTLLAHRAAAPWEELGRRYALRHRQYAVLTLHRPSNVDHAGSLLRLLDTLEVVGRDVPVVFPAHPRTMQRLRDHGLLQRADFLRRVEPLGYLEFLALMDHACCVLTDSGGIQEETTVLGVPCFTLRDNTERPITITEGTNTLVGGDGRGLGVAWRALREGVQKAGRVPPRWDGHAGARVAEVFASFLNLESAVASS
jgi:UDP-N-acetylglucosamine 2-epimerase (non-hydrolysing)